MQKEGRIQWNKGKSWNEWMSEEGSKKALKNLMKDNGENIHKGTKRENISIKLRKAYEEGRRTPIKMIGENNHNWKGGISAKNHIIRRTPGYRKWVRRVFERDKFTCQICKVYGGKIEAHHIKPFAQFPELRFEINNGITVHKGKCHKIASSTVANFR